MTAANHPSLLSVQLTTRLKFKDAFLMHNLVKMDKNKQT